MDLLGPDGIPNVLSRINLAKMFCDLCLPFLKTFFLFSFVFPLFFLLLFTFYYYFFIFFAVFFFFLFSIFLFFKRREG